MEAKAAWGATSFVLAQFHNTIITPANFHFSYHSLPLLLMLLTTTIVTFALVAATFAYSYHMSQLLPIYAAF